MVLQDNQPRLESDAGPSSLGYKLALAGLLLLAMAWFQWITVSMYYAHRLYLADVGLFNWMMSHTWQGEFLVNPLAPHVDGNYFGIHFQPVFMLVLPLYRLFDHPLTLVCFLTFFLVLAAWPLAELARLVLRSEALALGVAVLFLGNHFVASIHMANHSESLGFAPMFLAFLARERRKPVPFAIGIGLVLLLKEDYALYVVLYGLYLLTERDGWRWGVATIAAGIAGGMLASIVMKACGLEEYTRLGMVAASRYTEMGETPLQVLAYLFVHPISTIGRIAKPVLLLLVGSTGVICLLDWKRAGLGLLAAVPFLLTGDHIIARLDYYYSYAAVPFLFLATIGGARLLRENFAERRALIDRVLVVFFVVIALGTQFFPTRTDNLRHLPLKADPRFRMVGFVLEDLPVGATVGAQHQLFCRVPSDRRALPIRPWSIREIDYLLVDDMLRMSDVSPDEAEEVLRETGKYRWELVSEEMGIRLLKKEPMEPGSSPDPSRSPSDHPNL
ncbi:DUF2079 domain-containing protein [bacterium]|nr:DUF2079 domain-containing protein [bacterium]